MLAVVAVLQKVATGFSGFENKCDELRDKFRNVEFSGRGFWGWWVCVRWWVRVFGRAFGFGFFIWWWVYGVRGVVFFGCE